MAPSEAAIALLRRGALVALIAAALAGCPKPQPAPSLAGLLPSAVAAPTIDPSLGTRARIVPFEPPPIDAEATRVLLDNLDRAPVEPDEQLPPLTKEALEDTARGEARGLELDGVIHGAKLGEADRAVLPVEIAPGECITVIAHGGLGVMEVDAFVARHALSPPHILAQDSRNGPISVVGGLAGCWPLLQRGPVTLDVIIQARSGSGHVVYAVYRSRTEQ